MLRKLKSSSLFRCQKRCSSFQITNFMFSNYLNMNYFIPHHNFSTQLNQKITSESSHNLTNSYTTSMIRNIAIIAHVDHGKTTLVDALLKQSGIGLHMERAMDSNALEQEKGITILSKCTSIIYKNHRINIVDTPGHQDFGGEVERVIQMVDGVILLVCACEGPMPQTKSVLQAALKNNLKPIIIINKADRPAARIDEVESEVYSLFEKLGGSMEQLLDSKIFYASGRNGWAVENRSEIAQINNNNQGDVLGILDAVISSIPCPKIQETENFRMLVNQTDHHTYFGKLMLGKIISGEAKLNEKIISVDQDGKLVESGKIFKILKRQGMNYFEIDHAVAGDIISIAGLSNSMVGHTLNIPGNFTTIPTPPITPPIVSINFIVNNSPLQGKSGSKITAHEIKQRLLSEAENDVALKVNSDSKGQTIEVQGRGDLHLGILIEKMRREDFEFAITPPQVLTKKNSTGELLEPFELVIIEVEIQYLSQIMEKIKNRKGILVDCNAIGNGDRQKLVAEIPTRGLTGLRTEILHETQGKGTYESYFKEYKPYQGSIKKSSKGAILSTCDGKVTAYGLRDLEKFGIFFVKPGDIVYTGMVIGEHTKDPDIEVNPTKEKKLTNVRTHSHDEAIKLAPPKIFTIEELISYVKEDEVVEVTPKNIRLRKVELDSSLRKRNKKINA